MEDQPERTLRIEDLCDELNIAQKTIRKYHLKGLPYTKGQPHLMQPNLYNAEEVAAWLKAQGYKGSSEKTTHPVREKILKEQHRKLKAQADKYEMELAQTRGKLIPREEVEQGRVARIQLVRDGLLGLPASLAPQLVGLGAGEIQDRLEQEMIHLLEQFSKK